MSCKTRFFFEDLTIYIVIRERKKMRHTNSVFIDLVEKIRPVRCVFFLEDLPIYIIIREKKEWVL